MKIWISKYALTAGIMVEEMDFSISSPEYVTNKKYFLKLGVDAHKSKEEAVKKANAMQLKKIASLRKQLKKVEDIVF